MKTSFDLLSTALLFSFVSCNNKQNTEANADSVNVNETITTSTTSDEVVPGSYVNLYTGETVYIIQDPETGYAIDSIERIPVEFYINPSTSDTLFKTGVIVNNALVKMDGKWKLDETKVKIDGDKIKIKTDSSKLKIDGDESKLKEGDYKQKVDGDEVKTKDGDSKTKSGN